ncbi:MAG TPA: hypothetical protein VGI36_21550 [Candidatus Binataceae bacterium]
MAEISSGTLYRSQKVAVSANDGSISETPTSSAFDELRSAAARLSEQFGELAHRLEFESADREIHAFRVSTLSIETESLPHHPPSGAGQSERALPRCVMVPTQNLSARIRTAEREGIDPQVGNLVRQTERKPTRQKGRDVEEDSDAERARKTSSRPGTFANGSACLSNNLPIR